MLEAVLNAFADSVNALLIGILVAIGIMLPRGKYRKVAALILVGDWLGVLTAAVVVTFIFVGIRDQVAAVIESPVAGWVLIFVGIGLGILAWRSKGEPNELVNKLLGPLREPSWRTVVVGYAMGVIQSLTSVPFFYGLMHLAAGNFSAFVTYGGLLFYASFALSLPTVCGLFIAVVRAKPESWAGRAFAWARENSAVVSLWGGYVVAIFLAVMGLVTVVQAG
ncbi:hypothetical protein [Corynebacterium sp.]|uniref:hypothetical protein n=1 Tax=Corynebacterium sp. TaxID=1720 RepID=UPI0026DCA8C0|nr:hypothetical protein [Corynebacterium sp.]MDO5033055.1 hypothetical protein [Corynebacterium sp.]